MKYRLEETARHTAGFTILEVMIALTASLLIMLGLTRAFKMVGDRVTESQSDVMMSSELRDINFQLRTELRRRTANVNQLIQGDGGATKGDGYVSYHEGPWTNTTSLILDQALGNIENQGRSIYFPNSRIGDIDDFLAFTAEAKPEAPFRGVIPRGVLDAVRYFRRSEQGLSGNPSPVGYDPTALIPFESTLAEIAYWVSPTWERTPAGALVYNTDTNYPQFVDVDNDLFPDRFNLHRRVLLIRPDLNLTPRQMLQYQPGAFTPGGDIDVPQLPFLVNRGGNWQIVPLTTLTGNQDYFGSGGTNAPQNPSIDTATVAPAWLTGLAVMQQVMDLSLHRVVQGWDPTLANPAYGTPTGIVTANTLASVTRPENRFGMVRVPANVFSTIAASTTTLPMLALCPPHAVLASNAGENVFPAQASTATSGSGANPGPQNESRYGYLTLKTFLRPEFILSDHVGTTTAAVTHFIGRAGEDVIARNIIAFDVRVFDPEAPIYAGVGPDGEPGVAGLDDTTGETSAVVNVNELGWQQTDDVEVRIDDPMIDQVLDTPPLAISGNITYEVAGRGDFVDLGYARLAGSPVRGMAFRNPSGLGGNAKAARIAEIATPFSGLAPIPAVGAGPSGWMISEAFQRNGRFVLSGRGRMASFTQWMFDSSTNQYERDPFIQEGVVSGTPSIYTVGLQNYRQTLPGGVNRDDAVWQRFWNSGLSAEASISAFSGADRSQYSNGTTRRSSFFAGATQFSSESPITVTPPMESPLLSLSVGTRLYDPETSQLRQQTLVEQME